MSTPAGGWQISRSIAGELDVAVYLSQIVPREGLGSGEEGYRHEVVEFLRSIPSEWLAELEPWTTSAQDWLSVLEFVARWSGVLYSGDYEAASHTMRSLTVEDATRAMVEKAEPYGLRLDQSQEPVEALCDLAAALDDHLMTEIELHQTAGGVRPLNRAAHIAASTLIGGALHDGFWHWVDRLYYGLYRDWRASREEYMLAQQARAEQMLGGTSGEGAPTLDWLPKENVLWTLPRLRELVESEDVRVVFWAEPFGLADTWTILPGVLKVTFAEPGALSRQFDAALGDLAAVMKALADPTRLRILRMIRHYDLDNTQLATHLGIARPTVSVHARILRDAGLITTARVGRQARHTLNPDALQRVHTALGTVLEVEDR